ncbi:type II secretion system protein N [Thauera propionica]|uniref:type II secretion system protein N n=1 Tax=Thauera propionica TaxID=2019431 RepID=UPI0023F397A8|nr:type II secretion system protein N [Thauera propionica]MDD3677197.1 type II secretion system protein N [Thauera propionica]
MLRLGNHRGWTAVVESGFLRPLAWLLSLTLVAWLAADAFWSRQALAPVIAMARHVGDPRAVAASIVQRAGDSPAAAVTGNGQATAAPPFVLVGLATGFGAERGFALFESTGGQRHTLLAGESGTDGWRLIAIHPDRVVLERNDRAFELILAEPGGRGAAATGTAAAPAGSTRTASKP